MGSLLYIRRLAKNDEFYISLSLNTFSLLLNDSYKIQNMSRSNSSLPRVGGIA